jgi:hypothetical protein
VPSRRNNDKQDRKRQDKARYYNRNFQLKFKIFGLFSLKPKNCKLNLQDTEEVILLYLAARDLAYHCFFFERIERLRFFASLEHS